MPKDTSAEIHQGTRQNSTTRCSSSRRPILAWLVATYVAFITLWLLLRVLFFDSLCPLAILNTLAEYLFVPLPLLLVASIWQRHRASLLMLGIPIVAFIVLFGELFWPPFPGAAHDDGQLITAMSFNVLHTNKAYEAIVSSIESASPDIVGLQELKPKSAQALASALEAEYPYTTLWSLEPGQSAGLLSRYPIESAEWFPLPPLDIALHTIIRIEGQRVHVFVVHLSPTQVRAHPRKEFVPRVFERYKRRAAEVTRLQEEINALDEPVVLMCDCNFTDTSEAYARLNTVLDDSFREVGWGFGHTLNPPEIPFPTNRADYVWHSDDFVAVEALVGHEGSSDHLPMVAKLRLTR
jgi:vancomycin resistance protein VanJ